MRERAQLLGGMVEFTKPALGKGDGQLEDEVPRGTLVRLTVPRRNLDSNAA